MKFEPRFAGKWSHGGRVRPRKAQRWWCLCHAAEDPSHCPKHRVDRASGDPRAEKRATAGAHDARELAQRSRWVGGEDHPKDREDYVRGALIHPLRRRYLTVLALMPRLAGRLAPRQLLDLLRANRRRSARDSGGSDDGGIELLPEFRVTSVYLPPELFDHRVLLDDPRQQHRILLTHQRVLRSQLNKLIIDGHAP